MAAWATRCNDAAKPQERTCVLSRALVDPSSKRLMVAVTFRIAPPDRKPVMKLLLPVDLYLPAGVKLSIDQSAAQTLKFETCIRGGCLAPVPLDGALLQRLRRGTDIKVGYQTVDQKPVELTLNVTRLPASTLDEEALTSQVTVGHGGSVTVKLAARL